MNTLDTIFLIILGGSVILSLFRGGTKEIFSILAIVFGTIAASKLYAVGTKLISSFIANTNLANTISFVLIFLLTNVVINVAGIMCQKLLKILMIGWLDRLAGGVFGILRGILLVSVIIIVLTKFPLGLGNKFLDTSQFLPYFRAFIKAILVIMPDEFSSVLTNLTK